jgi:hypothetical protein
LLLQYTLYQEEAALLYFMTESGVLPAYDRYFMRRSYTALRHKPEYVFEIMGAPAPLDPQYYFLKSWTISQQFVLEAERAFLWAGLLGFASYLKSYDDLSTLYPLYLTTLQLMSESDRSLEKVYFSVGCIILQSMGLLGIGGLTYHYEKIWRKIKMCQGFHQDFLHNAAMKKEHFDILIEHSFSVMKQHGMPSDLFLYWKLC